MRIRFYETASGRQPVRDYLSGLRGPRAEEIDSALRDVEREGLGSSAVDARHIEGKLWELRFSADRVF